MKKIILAALVALALPAQAQYAHRSNPGAPESTPATITAAGTANAICVDSGSGDTAFVSITGTWSGTANFVGTNDRLVTTKAVALYPYGAGGALTTAVTTTTANGDFQGSTQGFRQFCVYLSVATSGTLSARVDVDPSSTFEEVQGVQGGVPVPTTLRLQTILGCYAVGGDTTYATTTANTPLFSFRWTDATRFAVILGVDVHVLSEAITTSGTVNRQLVVARSFTASDTGGAALTPVKLKASYPASLVGDLRVGVLTPGTRTLDASPLGERAGWMASTGVVIPPVPIPMFVTISGGDPLVLGQFEGFIVQFGNAEPASTRHTFVNVTWCEVTAYP